LSFYYYYYHYYYLLRTQKDTARTEE